MAIENRDIRQREIVPPDRIKKLHVTVVGVGAIGRQVSIQLAAMGIRNLKFIDPDTVAPENLSAQGFLEDDLEKHKVDAVADLCRAVNSEISIQTVRDLYAPSMRVGEVVFCCVDSMKARQFIFESISEVALFIDTRMSAESMRILAVDQSKGEPSDWYDETMFGDEEAYGTRCTAKSTIYCASIAAGLAISEFTKWLRDMPVTKDAMLNLLSGEMVNMSRKQSAGWDEGVIKPSEVIDAVVDKEISRNKPSKNRRVAKA